MMKIISATKTSEDVNRVKEKGEKSRHQSGKRKTDKNDKYDESSKSCFFCDGIVPSRKEIVHHEITDAVNVEEEITLQVRATNLESA